MNTEKEIEINCWYQIIENWTDEYTNVYVIAIVEDTDLKTKYVIAKKNIAFTPEVFLYDSFVEKYNKMKSKQI